MELNSTNYMNIDQQGDNCSLPDFLWGIEKEREEEDKDKRTRERALLPDIR